MMTSCWSASGSWRLAYTSSLAREDLMVNFSVRTLSLLDKALVLGVVATLAACGSNALGPE
ncbi:MAG TPA: hypothetical protein VIP79_01765 [Gemmatimonadaceae bacterium]